MGGSSEGEMGGVRESGGSEGELGEGRKMGYKIHIHVYIALWPRGHPLGQKKVSWLVSELSQLASGLS